MTNEEDFQNELDRVPYSLHLRLVFADWLEEQEDERAAGYRAIAVLPCLPDNLLGEINCPCYGRGAKSRPTSGGWLPPDWFDLVELRGKTTHFAPYYQYVNDVPRRELEDAVARAFSRLPAARQKELLRVPVLCGGGDDN